MIQRKVVYIEEGMDKTSDAVNTMLEQLGYVEDAAGAYTSTFRKRGETIEVFLYCHKLKAVRIELYGGIIDAIYEIDPTTCRSISRVFKLHIAALSQDDLDVVNENGRIPVIDAEATDPYRYFTWSRPEVGGD